MSQPDLVVFDMIGTTVQSSENIPQAFISGFAGGGVHRSPGDVSSIRGKSKRAAIHELLLSGVEVTLFEHHSPRVLITHLLYFLSTSLAGLKWSMF